MKFPKKRPSKLTILVWLLLVAVVVAGGSYLYQSMTAENDNVEVAELSRPAVKSSQPTPTSQFASLSEIPVRLVIDKIGVDALIETVGLTPDGLMDAPNTDHGVGWYSKSARAGEKNYAMLLDGHYGTAQAPAVFYRLTELGLGDSLKVHGDNGAVLEYKVVEMEQQYASDVDMRKAMYPYRKGVQSMTIITCEGEYDATNNSYDKRTIVYAERIA